VSTEDGDGARGNLVNLVNEMRAFRAQPLDNMPIVDNFVADIDRRSVFLERTLYDLDRSFDPRAEPSGLG
jgi:hypothetical protein